jgi:hypothetical protein
MTGKMVEAENAYRELFTLWKNADKTSPLVLKAHNEFVEIRRSKRGDLGEPTKPR